MEVLDLDGEVAENEPICETLGDSLRLSLLARLQECDSSSQKRGHSAWEEYWLVEEDHQKHPQLRMDPKYQEYLRYMDYQECWNGQWSRKSTFQRKFPESDGGGDDSMDNAIVIDQLQELNKLKPQELNVFSELVKALNSRCCPSDKQNGILSNVADTVSRPSLVVIKFRTRKFSTDVEHGVQKHDFQADYLLGFSLGNVSVGNKIISFPYASSRVVLSLAKSPTRQLTGVIRLAYDRERKSFGKLHKNRVRDRFPSYEDLFLNHELDFLYPKIVFKMKAEEILELTSL